MTDTVDQSGVVITRALDGHSPYYVINYDATTASTESVTDGTPLPARPRDGSTDNSLSPCRTRVLVTIATATAYGVAMEAGQAFLPHRSPFLLTDVIVNAVGASLVLVWVLLRPYLDLRAVSTSLPDAG